MSTTSAPPTYPARFEVDYPSQHNRLTALFRVVLIIPIVLVNEVLTAGVASGLFLATLLMILFRHRYPRWWFDFAVELTRFGARIGAYLVLLTDKYPSTVEEQDVHIEIDYPEAEQDLNRGLPLVKWFLAIPHFVVLIILSAAAFIVVVIAWFAILITGRYPWGLFDFVVGVGRWWLRVQAYAFLLVTDEYPPFSLR